MAQENPITPLAARRQMSFLSTFEKKFQGFRREMERLRRASSTGKAFGGRWPTEGLERTARSLVGAGAVYGLPEITDWARNFLTRLDTIRMSQDPPSMDNIEWLGERLGELERLQADADDAARLVLVSTGSLPPEPMASSGARDSKPFIAPSATTDPPPPYSDKREPQPAVAASAPTPYPPPETPAPPGEASLPPMGRPTMELAAARATLGGELRSLVLLAVKDSATAGKIQFTLKNAGFEVKKSVSLENLGFEAREESPELVVVDIDEAAPGGSAALTVLSRDPLTDFIPVLKIGTAEGQAGTRVLPKPIVPERLVAEARRLASPDIHSARITLGLRDPNLSEMIDFVCDELRAGVLDSATGDHIKERFRLMGEGHLMASVWNLVAQMRKAAAQGSKGKIRFIPATSGQMGIMALAEADEVLDASGYAEIDDAGIISLDGLRVIVADDDPEIRVVFDKVLTGAGMKVRTAADGMEALEAIRENPPDLLITDILMPGMDGWELCNRLRRDYALRHIPVILLSWKEDFLERLRGLNVNADGFMLKEVDQKQILARAARVMKPRFVLQRQLGIHGDVTGRIERVGVFTVLLASVVQRPDCRVTFRESWNYFEADIRDGELVAVTRTGTDGSFSSGPPALERLLGTSSGRFAILEAADTPRKQFKEGTVVAIQNACRRLNNMVAQITDGALLDIANVELDPDVIELYSKIMPPKLNAPLQRLLDGESPREIILSHETSPDALETLLLDLVRVGAVVTIAAPPPDLTRAPITRDSARWKAIGDGEILPADEEGARPIRKSSIPPKPPLRQGAAGPDDGGRESSHSSLPPSATSSFPESPPMSLEPLESPRGLVSRGWQFFALVVLIALALSVYFNVKLWDGVEGEPASKSTPAATIEKAALETPKVEPPKRIEPAPEPEVEAAPEPEVVPEPVPQPEQVAADELPEEDRAKGDDEERSEEDERAAERRRRRRKKMEEENPYSDLEKTPIVKPTEKPAEEKKVSQNPYEEKPAKISKESAGGILVIGVPPDIEGPVKVKVDGKNKGTAPLRVSLSPGLHEVTLTVDGQRTMRMVSIKEGGEKTITAKAPQ